jgi:hypothetical protein
VQQQQQQRTIASDVTKYGNTLHAAVRWQWCGVRHNSWDDKHKVGPGEDDTAHAKGPCRTTGQEHAILQQKRLAQLLKANHASNQCLLATCIAGMQHEQHRHRCTHRFTLADGDSREMLAV